MKNEIGNRYGRLKVLAEAGRSNSNQVMWKCLCNPEFGGCGNIKTTRGTELRNGNTRSCGCLNRERSSKANTGKNSPTWNKEGRSIGSDGYTRIRTNNGWRREHLVIAEKALNRSLKKGEIVHHINSNKADNINCNLLICNQSYHLWLHHKMSELYAKEKFGAL